MSQPVVVWKVTSQHNYGFEEGQYYESEAVARARAHRLHRSNVMGAIHHRCQSPIPPTVELVRREAWMEISEE